MKEVNNYLQKIHHKLENSNENILLFFSNENNELKSGKFRKKILSILALDNKLICYIYQPTRTSSEYCLYVERKPLEILIERPQYSRVISQPFIKWKHIDGPLLVCSNGTIYWLSIIDILLLFFKIKSIYDLDLKYK